MNIFSATIIWAEEGEDELIHLICIANELTAGGREGGQTKRA